jgi:8-oxo-dGTP pyrophosphatase MutT (NUDIX family)
VKTELKKALAARRKHVITEAGRVPSAVLIPLFKDKGEYHVVFIKRTDTVKTHKGQISFPGGARDKDDKTLRDTAVRESFEEIGVKTGDVEIIGELDDEITTTSNYIVTPFVGVIPWPYKFTPNKDEVDRIIEVPVSCLLDKDCLKPAIETLDGIVVDSFAYHYNGNVIWGATARILNKFLGILSNVK